MNQTTALNIIENVDTDGPSIGGSHFGYEPGGVRDSIDALGIHDDVNEQTDLFARSFLHLHFDTGINLNHWVGAKEWLDTVFVDFDSITVPGRW